MIQLNLLPDLKKEFIKAQKSKSVIIGASIMVTLGAIGISALLFVYVTFVQQVQINWATDEINKKSNELKNIPDINKYLTIQNQLGKLPELHEGKGAYSRLFGFMNILNPAAPNNVSLASLQLVTEETSIIFTGNTTNFETFNIFVDTLKNAEISYKENGAAEAKTEKMFDVVMVQSSGLSKSGNQTVVAFTVQAAYKESVFDVRNTEATVKVPNITTTGSVTEAPKPLFDNGGGN